MHIFQSILLGIIEGVTEFLPVSSTAHLILMSRFLGLRQTEFQTFFEVFIQSGAILSVTALYLKYLLTHRSVLKNILASFIPTAVIGFALHKVIKTVFFQSEPLIIGSMVVIALVFLFAERKIKNGSLQLKKSVGNLTTTQALLIGLAQSLAVVPGVSRAGIIVVAMMMMGFKRDESAKYSFMLAIPTILAASALDFYQSREILTHSTSQIGVLAVGFITAFATAYLSVKWLIRYLQTNTLTRFAYYRILLAIIVLLTLVR